MNRLTYSGGWWGNYHGKMEAMLWYEKDGSRIDEVVSSYDNADIITVMRCDMFRDADMEIEMAKAFLDYNKSKDKSYPYRYRKATAEEIDMVQNGHIEKILMVFVRYNIYD